MSFLVTTEFLHAVLQRLHSFHLNFLEITPAEVFVLFKFIHLKASTKHYYSDKSFFQTGLMKLTEEERHK